MFWGDVSLAQFNKNLTCGTGSVTCGSLVLGGTSYTSLPSGPVMRSDGATGTYVLTNETIVKAGNPLWTGGANQNITLTYTLPSTVANARTVEWYCDHYGQNGVSPSVVQIQVPSASFHISANSVGTLLNYQNNGYYGTCRLVCRKGYYKALFESSTSSWTILGAPAAGP